MGRLDTFVAPRPSRAMIYTMKHVNRIFMLKGISLLRDVPGLNRIPPFRGLANVRDIDLPHADLQRLKAVCGQGKATFFTPNHPEFFTDWMIDKELLSRVAPLAASWATSGVVNGLGTLAQRFWLANNLIAQIPGNSEPAKQHSVGWALKGHGVLLHPEGGVGWHSNYVDHLMPGAAEMAEDALRRGAQEAWLAPMVWKLAFKHNVEAALMKECDYVERRLKIARSRTATLPERAFDIYRAVLRRDAERLDLAVPEAPTFSQWHYGMLARLCDLLGDEAAAKGESFDGETVLRRVRRELRQAPDTSSPGHKRMKALADCLATSLRLAGSWAFSDETITQEEIAEHIKRLRNDYCKGTLRDTLNAFVPQPVGPRVAHIRIPEPIAVHAWQGNIEAMTEELRNRMQATLDAILTDPMIEGRFISYPNPFYPGLPDLRAGHGAVRRVSRPASAG